MPPTNLLTAELGRPIVMDRWIPAADDNGHSVIDRRNTVFYMSRFSILANFDLSVTVGFNANKYID